VFTYNGRLAVPLGLLAGLTLWLGAWCRLHPISAAMWVERLGSR
jgi:hypothetical protein